MIRPTTNKTLKLNTHTSNIVWGSDFHFDHDPNWDIPLWKMRGWNSVEESNEAIIADVNKTFENFQNTKPNILILLGDVYIPPTKDKKERNIELLKRLNADKIYYIFGNHEPHMFKIANENNDCNVEFLGHYKDIRVDTDMIAAMHYPIGSWNKKAYGAWMLHGHCHNSYELGRPFNLGEKILDVGVESALEYSDNEHCVFTHEDVRLILANKKGQEIDHHINER
jgi:calcineurin-like phosphoesterase family protein